MTEQDAAMLTRINKYAEEVLSDIDPQKTRISYQLEKLRPIMEELSKEMNQPIEDIFIHYMDLASEASVIRQTDMESSSDTIDFDLKV